MKSKTKYYLIKHKEDGSCGWLGIVCDGKLLKEYNIQGPGPILDVTDTFSDKYKDEYLKRTRANSNYSVKEITEEEAFLMLL